MNKFLLLRCSVGPGQFRHEFAVSGSTADGKGFFGILPKDLVETDDEAETTTGWIQVEEIGRNENTDQVLVKFPRPDAVFITVRAKDLR